jgi:hypothetical protein
VLVEEDPASQQNVTEIHFWVAALSEITFETDYVNPITLIGAIALVLEFQVQGTELFLVQRDDNMDGSSGCRLDPSARGYLTVPHIPERDRISRPIALY